MAEAESAPAEPDIILVSEQLSAAWEHTLQLEFFMIRSHLHFKPEFTSRVSKNFSKKLPQVEIEPTTLTITGSKVECLSK